MTQFVGRFADLQFLHRAWSSTQSDAQSGRCVVITGAAGVGKTRLMGEFLGRAQPAAFFFAAQRPGPRASGTATQLAAFVEAAATSGLPKASLFRDILAPDWDTALKLLADALGEAPAIVVLDNVTDIVESDRAFVTALRRVWQRTMRSKPVLMLLSGRELNAVIEALQPAAGGEADEVAQRTLRPFDPAEFSEVLGLGTVASLDAYLVTGGHPDVVAQWPVGASALDAVHTMISRRPSALDVRAELFLSRELGEAPSLRTLAEAAGAGSVSRAGLGRATGLPPATLDRALKLLSASELMEIDRPRSLHPSREARYRLADPYLRFWFQMLDPNRERLARGDEAGVLADIEAGWQRWRLGGMRVLARQAMNRLAQAGKLPGTGAVGGFWNRFEDVHIDLVGTDSDDDPQAVTFVGALKWEQAAFDHYDLASLIAVREQVPGVTRATPLVAVTLGGSAVGDAVAAVLGPDELLSAWSD